jgi:hypothetical protein
VCELLLNARLYVCFVCSLAGYGMIWCGVFKLHICRLCSALAQRLFKGQVFILRY